MPDIRRLSRALVLVGGALATLCAADGNAGAAPLNLNPVAGADSATVQSGETSLLDVLSNDTDPGGNLLSVLSTTAPMHGTATVLPDGQIQYVPTNGYLGPDQFTYTVSDGQSTGVGAVALTVLSPPAPTGLPGTFVSLAPARVLDTRIALGSTTPAPQAVASFQVAGKGGVPLTGAAAVVLNLTVDKPTASGYVTAYADGADRPTASNLNFVAGDTLPNLAIVPLGADGKVALFNGSTGRTPLVADVAGYFLTGPALLPGTFTPLSPARVLDTRNMMGGTRLSPHGVLTLQVGGVGGVPALGVSAVVLNVTAARPTDSGYLTAYASGTARPTASNLNFTRAQVVPNLVIAPVSSDGKVDFYNGSTGMTPLVADVFGYFLAGPVLTPGAFSTLPPARILDTRIAQGGTTPGPLSTVHMQVGGSGGVPASGAAAVVVNLTADQPTGRGWVTAYGDGGTRPLASNLNFLPGQTRPNLAIPPVGAGGRVALYNGSNGRTPLVADVAGYFLADPTGITSTFSDGSITLIPHCVAGLLTWVGVSVRLTFPTDGAKLLYLGDGGILTLLENVVATNDGSGLITADLTQPAVAVTLGQSTIRVFARNGTSPLSPIVFDHSPTLPTCS